MSLILRQSTAKAVSFGPFVDKADGVTLEVGLVSALDHASTGIFLSKNGGALTIRHASVTASTYDAYGNYIVTLDTTDTNTCGTLRMQFSEAATCLPVWQDFIVVEEAVFDALFAASAAGYQVPIWAAASSTVNLSATTIKTATDVETDTNALQTDWANGGRLDLILDIIAADTTTDIPALIATLQAFVDTEVAAILAAVDTEVALILADTNELQTDWADGGRLDLILDARATQTSVDDLPTSSELATALGTADDAVLAAIADLPTNTELATALGTADDAVLAQIALIKAKTDALATAADIVDAVWDEATSGHATAGTTGKALTDAGAAGTPPTASEIADEVETREHILTTAYDAAKTAATQTSVDDLPTNTELATALGTADDAVLAAIADLPTNTELATALGTADDAVLAQIALVKAKTDSLTFTKALELDANIQSINGVAVTGDGSAGDKFDVV